MASRSHYTYTPLASLSSGFHVNFYGVISSVSLPNRVRSERGTNKYHCCVSVTDPSLCGEAIPLILFRDNLEKFPSLSCQGKILRCHRMKVTLWNGKHQASSNFDSSWLVMDSPSSDSPLLPILASSTSFTFTDADRRHLQDLRGWMATPSFSHNFHQLNSSKDMYMRRIEGLESATRFDLWCKKIRREERKTEWLIVLLGVK